MISPERMLPTEFGPVQCSRLDEIQVHHVGYKPTPWNWADWAYATGDGGRFEGRWDDPSARWRAKYVGEEPVACYLEVLACFRPDSELQTDMDVIEDDDEDEPFSTAASGTLDTEWCESRLFCEARLSGDFVMPSHSETLPTLREQFLPFAKHLGLVDVDAAAVKAGEPRVLTQSISAWLYEIVGPEGERVNGVQYQSRHGDELVLWAVYERGGSDSPVEVTAHEEPRPITPDDAVLMEAMRIHRIDWLRKDGITPI